MSKRQHEWTYKQQGSESEMGPVAEAQFVALVKNGTIVGSTLVRSSTRTKNKWIAVNRIPAVTKFIKQSDPRQTSQSPKALAPNAQPPTNKLSKAKDLATAAEPVLNPYAAPLTDSAAIKSLGPPIAAETIYKRFKPLNSTAVTWLLRATMLAMAINAFCFLCFILWGRSKAPSIATAQTAAFVIQLILWIATGIFFLIWKHQAYANLKAACVNPLKTSAGWCVAVYFIPFVHLYRPVTAMYEIQSRSKAGIGSSVIGWWLLLILVSILSRVASTAPGDDNKAGQVLTIVAICLGIIAGYLLLKIIRTITEKQRRYWLFLESNLN
ncbi:MAG: DUF4328 domain-containing protein [Mariniblastus sp.]